MMDFKQGAKFGLKNFLLVDRVAQPNSSSSLYFEVFHNAPVQTRAASSWTDSRSSASPLILLLM